MLLAFVAVEWVAFSSLFAYIYVCVRQNIPLCIFNYIQLRKIRVTLNGTALWGEVTVCVAGV
jgi:hypothetical protein